MPEGYKYLEDIAIADLAFEVEAESVEKLLVLAGKALINAMILDLNSIETKVEKEIEIEAESLEMLLFNFLQELIFLKDSENLVFNDFKISIIKNRKYHAKITGFGEKLDPKKHETLVDVKAVTMHMFEVKEKNGNWFARVVLDV